jgi:hypothetical protein
MRHGPRGLAGLTGFCPVAGFCPMKNTSPNLRLYLMLVLFGTGPISALAQPASNPYSYTNASSLDAVLSNYFGGSASAAAPSPGQLGSPLLGSSALVGAGSSGYQASGPGLAHWGPVNVYPHLFEQFSYGNGVQAQPGVNTKTFIDSISPGTLLRLGPIWWLDYTPTWRFYSSSLYHNTTDENVNLHGNTTNGDWTLSLKQNYVDTTQPLVETGTQTEQVLYDTLLSSVWQMNDKLSLQLQAGQDFRFVGQSNSLYAWTTSDWLRYQVEPQFSAAVGVVFGYDELSLSSDMPFEQLQGSITFRPATKFFLTLSGGAEERQFISPSAPSALNPIFSALALYQLSPKTLITLTASRMVMPSILQNEINVNTTLLLDIREQISKRFDFDVVGNYTTVQFTSVQAVKVPQAFGFTQETLESEVREDTRMSARATFSFHPTPRLTSSIFFSLSQNSSSQANFSYTATQVGLELRYQF